MAHDVSRPLWTWQFLSYLPTLCQKFKQLQTADKNPIISFRSNENSRYLCIQLTPISYKCLYTGQQQVGHLMSASGRRISNFSKTREVARARSAGCRKYLVPSIRNSHIHTHEKYRFPTAHLQLYALAKRKTYRYIYMHRRKCCNGQRRESFV